MKKFILKYIIFVLPILIPLVLLEVCIRNIPNDYSYKNQYMSSHAASIETLILGNSHTYLGVNPEFIDSKSFNLAHVGETLEYDVKLFDNFKENLSNLKILVIPISYLSMFDSDLKNGRKNYNLYYELNETDFIVDNLEVLNKNWIDIIKDSYTYYYLNEPSPYLESNRLGWYDKKNAKEINYARMEVVAKQDERAHFHKLKFNLDVLEKLIYTNEIMGVKVVIVSTPLHWVYRSFLKDDQLNLALSSVNKLATDHKNVSYYNFMDSELFDEADFKDGDHLNAFGAEKFTLILNDIINKKLDSNE
jgi:hypothetical protein